MFSLILITIIYIYISNSKMQLCRIFSFRWLHMMHEHISNAVHGYSLQWLRRRKRLVLWLFSSQMNMSAFDSVRSSFSSFIYQELLSWTSFHSVQFCQGLSEQRLVFSASVLLWRTQLEMSLLSLQMHNISRLESTLHYRNEDKIDQAIRFERLTFGVLQHLLPPPSHPNFPPVCC